MKKVFQSRFSPVVLGLILCACSAAAPILKVLEQAACTIVPLADPKSSTYVGSVCQEIVPDVNAVVSALTASGALGAAKECKPTIVTPDGVTGAGSVCDFLCGDMSTATPTDPCPAVDARLSKSPAAKSLAARRAR